ncbi:nucleotidyltransferase AbiEii toxin of type IV toxin-antitoxin system [Volucribacter psittacicida]|uniref:Nucleotidyltransferase AbiEii toxin of type IV toxin-antitoxin system n=1 Tax=Volucribacter psittacicida TaxID=203482 RepID=A0A4R1G813_9PAST|nr:nucleotidyl transferase AbiEii/AbiGii toxin family protein [Volucribacter psittacicida]TCK01819.1 nucleotidyltransferase AbiEii toxin of type IV toxin-antitoxin system [Volucribacter psittacicida]
MVSILKNLADTLLVLKGGTALYLAYGLNRFSEDLDFDSDKKLNLVNRIKEALPYGFEIQNINIKKDTDTVSRYIINYHVKETGANDSLKIEVSYRTPAPKEQICFVNGIKVASIERILDNKLSAAFDGNNPRIKARDLFDLHFIAKNFPDNISPDLASRLFEYADIPDKLVWLYTVDAQIDPLLNNMDLETIALELNEIATRLNQVNQQEKHVVEYVQPAKTMRFRP